MLRRRPIRWAPLVFLLGDACTGRIGDPAAGEVTTPDPAGARAAATPSGTKAPAGPPSAATLGRSGAHRLTRAEYAQTVLDLLGVDVGSSSTALLPEDALTPFDNDFRTQQPSQALVEAVETLAEQTAARATADAAARARLVPCAPSGPADGACLRAFIRAFGRRALRHPLDDVQVERLAGLGTFSAARNDFWVGVELVVRALLQEPEFLYRIETGAPVTDRPGVYRLDDWEMASRLSYLLWGTMPDEALFASAASGKLRAASDLRAAATRMLGDARARARLERFAALWFGFDQPPHAGDLGAAVRAGSAALMSRVTFDDGRTFTDLFRSTETFATQPLAVLYGLTWPGGAGARWLPWGSSGRRGILSEAGFLSAASKFADTSPTQRGKMVRARLMCAPVPPPPPDVAADNPPAQTVARCKVERYAAHRKVAGCAACHDLMDPVGFGLENYDSRGQFRTHDDGAADCAISGQGQLAGLGGQAVAFHGPAELGDRLLDAGALQTCAATQLFRFATGRQEEPDDAPLLDQLGARLRATGRLLDAVLELVASEPFGLRREE